MPEHFAHALPFGAECKPDGTTDFRIWAPSVSSLLLEFDDGRVEQMSSEPGGWFSRSVRCAAAARYRYRLPDGLAVPDPASRLQSGDVHGWSVVCDPFAYGWRAGKWRGRPWHEAVVYELHVGLLSGFAGVKARLPEIKRFGFTAIELMPIADFPGRHNWGYDGVLPYAPDEAYGPPGELKDLIDTAHELGLMVFLDVVYNHFGPDGAYLHAYAKEFFDEGKHTPWGAAIDFRKPEVREYFLHNALYWIHEFRFDGLRFDAVHAIEEPGYLPYLATAIRKSVGDDRFVHLILEHEGNKSSLLGGGPRRFDAQWADDLHHCLHVLLTGESEGYYADYADSAPLLAKCLAEGFAYQGQTSPRGHSRGEPSSELPTTAFVYCLQNHDQIGNRAMGERLSVIAEPAAVRAAQALLLLAPMIPMVFMGEEAGVTSPFLFFTDHNAELAALVREGRRKEFAHFAAFKDEKRRAEIPDPNARSTFELSRPDWSNGDRETEAHFCVLLGLRHRHIIPRIEGTVSILANAIGDSGVLAKWQLGDGAELIIACNLGTTDVAVEEVGGAMMFESTPGDAALLQDGRLRRHCTVALLQERM
jgi:maltooligosyltrehalose trehalohydrolase